MIRPARWPHVTRFMVHAHYGAAISCRAYNAALVEQLNRQAHRALCDQLRTLAARIVLEG